MPEIDEIELPDSKRQKLKLTGGNWFWKSTSDLDRSDKFSCRRGPNVPGSAVSSTHSVHIRSLKRGWFHICYG